MSDSRTWRRTLIVAFAIAVVHAACFIFVYLPPALHGYGDFASFYAAGKIVATGHSADLYNMQTQWRVQQECCTVPIRQGPLLFPHAPYESLVFAPLAMLRYDHAYALWTIVNLGILGLIAFLLRAYIAEFLPRWWLMPLFALAWFPTIVSLANGQDSIIIALFFTLAFLYLKKQKIFAAGLWLSLASVKPQLLLPVLLIFCLRRQWRSLLGCLSGGVVLTLLSVLTMGTSVINGYVRFVLSYASMPSDLSAAAPLSMPNLRGLVLLVFDSPGATRTVVVILLSALVVWMASRFKGKTLEAQFALTITVTLLASYHMNAQDIVLLLIALIVFGARAKLAHWPSVILAVSVVPWFLLMGYYYLSARNLFSLYGLFVVGFGIAVWVSEKSIRTVEANQAPASVGA